MLPDNRNPVAEDFNVIGREFKAFIKAKCPGITCPACGSKDDPIVAADSADGPVHLMATPVMNMKGTAHATCIAFCNDCSFGWSFWANEVLNWAVEQRSKVSDDE